MELVSYTRNPKVFWIKMNLSKLIFLMLSVSLVYCRFTRDPCPSKQTCHECIQNPYCAWCAQEEFLPWVSEGYKLSERCFFHHNIQHPCRQEDIVNPSNTMTVVRNISVTSGTVNALNVSSHDAINSQTPVWISPQKLDLQLRIDKPYSIFVTYLNAPITRVNRVSGNHSIIEHITRDTVELFDNSTGDINITYFSRCKGPHYGSSTFSNKCEGLQTNDIVTFQIILQAKGCSNNQHDWKEYISIYPRGIIESLIINLEVICDCPCERETKVLQNSTLLRKRAEICSLNGDYICGICHCNKVSFGRHCECRVDGPGVYDCQIGDNPMICSGQGSCVCGKCECRIYPDPTQIVYGRYCECDNFSCARKNGLICSGPEHGNCICGYCQCKPDYTGVACECLDDRFCLPPNSTEMCSGNGRCHCGKCTCNPRVTGRFCETEHVNATSVKQKLAN